MLDPRTVALMQELFEGEKCNVCGMPAKRIRGKLFFCHEHATTSNHIENPAKYHTPYRFLYDKNSK